MLGPMQFQRGERLTCWGDRFDPAEISGLHRIIRGAWQRTGKEIRCLVFLRYPSETEVIHEKPLDACFCFRSKSSLRSPTPSDVAKEKNNRWYKVTIIIEPFSRTIKNWEGKTPTGTPAKASLATTPITTTTTTSTMMGAAPLPAQAHRQTAIFPSMGGKDAHSSSDSPALIIEARNVMQWFRPQAAQWCQARRRRPVCRGQRQHQHERPGKERRAATVDVARTRRYLVLVLMGRLAVHHVLAGGVGFCRLNSNWCSVGRLRRCERCAVHPPGPERGTPVSWCDGPDDDHDAPAARGREADLPGPRRARHGVQGRERVQVQACACEGWGSVGLWFSGVVGSNGLAAFTMVGSTASNGADMRGLPVFGGHAQESVNTQTVSQVSGPPSAPVDVD
ncbi:hypothetical protein SCLCIDRAFT_27173 [Scleroderma citrinum Foug A]|uniref:Uncharacterized protein n=1 Tax=Scleroderma citrinum Foug A TaxID=1036808 RepID=A0A0C3DG12_9AGAM|nr:hypothetical protein SCLCIDRAFT_27173 [Scleroderma citrinum Foug A]